MTPDNDLVSKYTQTDRQTSNTVLFHIFKLKGENTQLQFGCVIFAFFNVNKSKKI